MKSLRKILFWSGIFLVILTNIIIKPLGNLDEIWNFNFARCISNGLVPYKDISMVITPLVSFLSAIFLKIFGSELFVTRVLAAILAIVNLGIIYKICTNIGIKSPISKVLVLVIMYIMTAYFCLDYNFFILTLALSIILLEVKKQGKEKTINRAKKLSNALLKVGIDVRKKLFKQLLDKLGGNMRFVVSGAAAIDKQVAEDFNSWGILTIQGYGLTETSPVLCAENEKCLKLGSVGIPLIDVEVKIDNPNEKGIGEIIAKGPNVMLGYYKNEEATKNSLIDGWYHTGDLGYIDRSGYLFITGRKKNVIVLKNGKNIYPEEIEVLINNFPYVTETLVFGYPKGDDLILSAKIVYDEHYVKNNFKDLSKEEFEEKVWNDIKEINTTVPKYKHVKKIIVTDEPMIKTTTAKIKRFEEIEKIIKEKQIEL